MCTLFDQVDPSLNVVCSLSSDIGYDHQTLDRPGLLKDFVRKLGNNFEDGLGDPTVKRNKQGVEHTTFAHYWTHMYNTEETGYEPAGLFF